MATLIVFLACVVVGSLIGSKVIGVMRQANDRKAAALVAARMARKQAGKIYTAWDNIQAPAKRGNSF